MPRLRTVEPRLHVQDLARAVAFYRDRLGFTVTSIFPPAAPTFAMLARSPVFLQLGGPDGKHNAGERSTCTLWFDVEDVQTLHTDLAGHAPIEWGPKVSFYGRREFAVRDPDGNLLVFSEETSDPPTAKES